MRTLVKWSIGTMLACFALFTTAATATAQTPQPPPRVISVSGEGIVRVQPDMATLRFGVVTTADDPEEARRANATAAAAVLNAVRALGVPENKIQLEVLRLQPRREYNDELRRYEEKGFEATRIVAVVLEDLEKLPDLVARVVQEGANRLESVAYDLKDRDAARDAALREAVTKARAKAQLIAATLGVELGSVQRVDEQGFSFPRPMVRMAEFAMAKDQAAPEPDAYAAGEIEVQANVQAAFEIR